MPRAALTIGFIFLAIRTVCTKIDVTAVPSAVTVKPGEDVLLSCILTVENQQIDMKQLMVQWFHRGKQIAEYDNTVTVERPEYSLSAKELMKGNVSLFISKVKVEDSGNYRCYVYYQHDFRIKQIVLAVQGPNPVKEEEAGEPLPESAPEEDGSQTLKWVIQVKKAVDHLQETLNLMKTDVEKCTSGPHYKAPQP
ncbi:programmed cell death 1 ligand 1-like [Ambystoma mexicanum]|uniref:programmed cell death 1 ligand 1-like n=1 Tax=Ambystoma mexicanum TaxID=8296 RepID=UPI0037E737AD